MLKKLFFTLLSLSICLSIYSKETPPRQKIDVTGLTLGGKNLKISVDVLEKNLPLVKTTIFDPYNKNEKTTFEGFYFYDFVKKYAKPEVKTVYVKAIDGYSIETPIETMKAEKMILAIKDQQGYLGVNRMGPTRVIYPIEKMIDKDLLLKIGLHWVWQIKSLEFRK